MSEMVVVILRALAFIVCGGINLGAAIRAFRTERYIYCGINTMFTIYSVLALARVVFTM